jgi:glycosyltransferase involved in cell wall biosynthesis
MTKVKKKTLSISVITPVFNGANYLAVLIESIQSQNYPSIEHIIIDDGSTDDGATISILKRYDHIRWWSRENRGQYATMNEGLLAASGEVICFISADDLMAPSSIWKAVGFLSSHNEFVGVYGNYSFINSEGMKLNQYRPMCYMPTFAYPYSLHIAHSSFYILRNFLIENRFYFDDTLHYVGDYEWIVRILRSGYKIGRMKEDLSLIRLHETQTSKVGFYKMRQETQVIQQRLGVSFFWSSVFRKVMFIMGFINIFKRGGWQPAFNTIRDRLKYSYGKYENNSNQ